MIACPRCFQDYVVPATITVLNKRICICPECDSFWDPGEPVRLETYRCYGVYMEEQGFQNPWKLLVFDSKT